MRRACLVFLFASAAGIAPSQEPAEPSRTVIRAETQLVLVDASVADKKGEPVHDLTAKDFHVWEDGKEQTVASLSVETATVAPEKSSKHYLVLFFDDSTLQMSDQLTIRRDAARFVGAWAAPDRYISVIDFGAGLRITQGFTSLTAPLTQAISSVQSGGQGTETTIQMTDRNQTAPQPGIQSLSVTIPGMDASNAQSSPRPVANRGRGGPPAISEEQTAAQSGKPFAQQDLLSGLQAVAESLGSIRGRKTLVLLTGGSASAPSATQMAALISACNAANVAVYVANPASYKSLADGTGGGAILNVNDLVGQLGRIAEREDERYVLSYEPPESPAGSCHNLRVTVDRPSVDVEARKGYCSARPAGLVASAKPAEINTARANEPKLAASLQLPYFYSSANVARVNLAMEIASEGVKFDKSKGKPHAELHVAGVATKSDGSVAGKFDDAVKLDFETAKEAEAFARQPYHYEYQFDLAPGQYRIRVTVASGATNLGSVEAPLSVEPWDGRRLGLSGVAFSKEARPIADLAATLDDSLLEDHRALVAGSHQIVPSGSSRFRRTDLRLVYLEIYDPPRADPNPSGIALRIRFLDQSGNLKRDAGSVNSASFPRQGSPVIPVAFNLPDSLEPGAYRLEVTAARTDGADSVVRTADFEIEP